MGTGKSALVNSLIGKKVATEGNKLCGVTTEVTKYKRREKLGNLTLFVYDCPGLQDNIKIEDQCLKDINCNEVDLNLYCVKMNGRMHESNVIVKLSDAFGKEEFWRKTLFVLTFANEITLPPLDQYFSNRKIEWKTQLQDELMQNAGIDKGVAASVPIIPAGYSDDPSLPAAKCDCWLSNLWLQLADSKISKKQGNWEAIVIDHLQRKGKDSLHIRVIGRTGVGKSALINSICGDVAIEGDWPGGVTKKVTKYEKRVGNFTVYIHDTPGLQGNKEIDQSLKDWCSEVDLNFYCVEMNDRMHESNVINKLSDAFGKEEFWRKTWFVLTFANKFKLPTLDQHFSRRKAEWKTLLQHKLTENAGIAKEVAASVPIIPVGRLDTPSLPTTECWLSQLRCQCEDRIREQPYPSEEEKKRYYQEK